MPSAAPLQPKWEWNVEIRLREDPRSFFHRAQLLDRIRDPSSDLRYGLGLRRCHGNLAFGLGRCLNGETWVAVVAFCQVTIEVRTGTAFDVGYALGGSLVGFPITFVESGTSDVTLNDLDLPFHPGDDGGPVGRGGDAA